MACGDVNKTIHVDHIKPRSKFPELSLVQSNLQILCADCNLGKSNKDQTDWRTPKGDHVEADRLPNLIINPENVSL